MTPMTGELLLKLFSNELNVKCALRFALGKLCN